MLPERRDSKGSLFRRDAETNTRDACATQKSALPQTRVTILLPNILQKILDKTGIPASFDGA